MRANWTVLSWIGMILAMNGFKQLTEVYKNDLRVSGDVANAPGVKTP